MDAAAVVDMATEAALVVLLNKRRQLGKAVVEASAGAGVLALRAVMAVLAAEVAVRVLLAETQAETQAETAATASF